VGDLRLSQLLKQSGVDRARGVEARSLVSPRARHDSGPCSMREGSGEGSMGRKNKKKKVSSLRQSSTLADQSHLSKSIWPKHTTEETVGIGLHMSGYSFLCCTSPH
jgi:hypothetical protein